MDKKDILIRFYTYEKLSSNEKDELIEGLKRVKLWDVDYQQKAIIICNGLNKGQRNSAYTDYERRALNPQNAEDLRIRNIFYILTNRDTYRLCDV